MVSFPQFPSSFWGAIFPFVVAFGILITSYFTGTFPNIVIFYFALFTAVILASGLVGFDKFVEYLGFDVNGKTWKIPFYILSGLVFGALIFKFINFLSSFGLSIYPFPLDLALSDVLLSTPFMVSAINLFIVAVGEEILRTYGNFAFANWVAKRFKVSTETAINVGVFISSIAFILLHLPAWNFTPNIFSYLLGASIAFLFSQLCFMFMSPFFGPFQIREYVIYPAIAGHFIYDVLVDMNLRLFPLWV